MKYDYIMRLISIDNIERMITLNVFHYAKNQLIFFQTLSGAVNACTVEPRYSRLIRPVISDREY